MKTFLKGLKWSVAVVAIVVEGILLGSDDGAILFMLLAIFIHLQEPKE